MMQKISWLNEGQSQNGQGNDDLVTVFRGTDKYTEDMIFQETGLFMSDAARKVYMETGDVKKAYAAAQETHKKWVSVWGDEKTYVQAHGEFGTELGREFGMDRTMVSVTTDKKIAEYFAGESGWVYEIKVPKDSLIPQTIEGAGESEYLIVGGTWQGGK